MATLLKLNLKVTLYIKLVWICKSGLKLIPELPLHWGAQAAPHEKSLGNKTATSR